MACSGNKHFRGQDGRAGGNGGLKIWYLMELYLFLSLQKFLEIKVSVYITFFFFFLVPFPVCW